MNSDGGITTAGFGAATGADSPNNFDQVPSPTTPSAFSPLAVCHALTAFSVPGPNEPSAPNPNFSWSFLTSSPLLPTFSNIY